MIAVVAEADLAELLPLMRSYCDFYEVDPRDEDLLTMSRKLIAACLERCRDRGASSLSWQTARDNHRAQRVYDRTDARREQWIDYSHA